MAYQFRMSIAIIAKRFQVFFSVSKHILANTPRFQFLQNVKKHTFVQFTVNYHQTGMEFRAS